MRSVRQAEIVPAAIIVFALGCSTPPSSSASTTTSQPEPGGADAEAAPTDSALAPVAPSSATSAKPSPPPDDPSIGAACVSDDECRWDDGCMPKRCVGGKPQPPNCDESAPEPGECKCVERQCTLEPKQMPKASEPCEVGGCIVDRAGGVCIADTRGVPENLRGQAPVEEGPSCDCTQPSRGCEMTWIDRVPCKTVQDCWVSPTPRTHPIKRPAHLRVRTFTPCADGTVPPRCTDEGFCALGSGYKC